MRQRGRSRVNASKLSRPAAIKPALLPHFEVASRRKRLPAGNARLICRRKSRGLKVPSTFRIFDLRLSYWIIFSVSIRPALCPPILAATK